MSKTLKKSGAISKRGSKLIEEFRNAPSHLKKRSSLDDLKSRVERARIEKEKMKKAS
jgi:hypothetical protein